MRDRTPLPGSPLDRRIVATGAVPLPPGCLGKVLGILAAPQKPPGPDSSHFDHLNPSGSFKTQPLGAGRRRVFFSVAKGFVAVGFSG